MHYFDMEYGRTGSPRVIKKNKLGYLYVEGDEFSIGLRPKKLTENWRSCNHWSKQQDELRKGGRFPWHKDTHHLFLGYRMASGLQPSLTHIAVTFENRSGVEWAYLLWTAEEGNDPVQTIQPPLPFVPPPKVRVRRKRADAGETPDQEKTG